MEPGVSTSISTSTSSSFGASFSFRPASRPFCSGPACCGSGFARVVRLHDHVVADADVDIGGVEIIDPRIVAEPYPCDLHSMVGHSSG